MHVFWVVLCILKLTVGNLKLFGHQFKEELMVMVIRMKWVSLISFLFFFNAFSSLLKTTESVHFFIVYLLVSDLHSWSPRMESSSTFSTQQNVPEHRICSRNFH